MALCILDFCVRAHHRRRGVGRKLFDSMLAYEGRRPGELPIDNPSAKMRSFLKRHYGLDAEQDSIPQLNRFTVFRSYPFECQVDISDKEQRDSSYERCIQERRDDRDMRSDLRDHGDHHEPKSVHRTRRWMDDPIYQQQQHRAPRHASEHRDYNSPDNSEKDSSHWCCNQEYSRRVIRQSRSEHFRMGDSDLRRAMRRSSSCSSWRVLGLEGPGNLNHEITPD